MDAISRWITEHSLEGTITSAIVVMAGFCLGYYLAKRRSDNSVKIAQERTKQIAIERDLLVVNLQLLELCGLALTLTANARSARTPSQDHS